MPQQFESSFYRVAADRKVVSIRKSSAKCPGLLSTQNESLDEAVLGPISSDFGFRARTISAQFRGSLSLSLSLRRFCFFAPAQGRTYADVHERRPPSSSPKKETRPVYPIDLASGGSPYLRPIYRPIYRIPLHSAEVGLALGGDLLAPSRGEAKQTRSNGTERLRRGTERGGGTEGHQSPVNLLQHSFLVAGVGFCRVRLRL